MNSVAERNTFALAEVIQAPKPEGVTEVFSWSMSGAPIAADVAAREVKRIYDRLGAIQAQDILDAAIQPKSPLHNCFNWNNDSAANLYRVEQARFLLRSLVVVYRKADAPDPPAHRYIVHVTPPTRENEPDEEEAAAELPPSRNFHRREEVLKDPALRAKFVERAIRELGTWTAKYGDIEELSFVVNAIKSLARQSEQAA